MYFRFDCCLVFLLLFFFLHLFTMAINDIVFEFEFEQSIIKTEKTFLLGINHPETELCHGTVSMRTARPVEKVNKKRRALSTRGGSVSKKKFFVCKYCDYQSNAKYMTDHHVAWIHEKSVEPQVCSFCQFSSLYSFNMKRREMRSHPNRETPISDSSSCNLRRSKTNSRVIELLESSCLSN